MAIILEKDKKESAKDNKYLMPYCSSKAFIKVINGGQTQ